MRHPLARKLPIMDPRQERERGDRPGQRREHVPLGVPRVALGAEEGLGRRPRRLGGPPLHQFVESTQSETEANDQKWLPRSAADDFEANEQLAGDDRRNEALSKVADAS